MRGGLKSDTEEKARQERRKSELFLREQGMGKEENASPQWLREITTGGCCRGQNGDGAEGKLQALADSCQRPGGRGWAVLKTSSPPNLAMERDFI